MFAEELPARYPILAAAQAAGELNPDQVNLVERALHRVDLIHPALLEEAEATLVGYARLFGPTELATVCTRLVDAIDPDGTRPDDAVHAEQRFLTLSACRDGMSSTRRPAHPRRRRPTRRRPRPPRQTETNRRD